ncbi:unnamed protein product [Brassicogethes aeneus]|uniref:Nose resistant-to-fluoxetine protein N-terminal domain-containing protein n=1 Tax=Brassicogethes aeneus TaxID=1431903 RepID=A0A9P0BCI4_BRAAE|nr:unnamed protein product [Brassicogethes aeneus]
MGTLGFFVFFLVLVNFNANAVLEFDKYVNILQNTDGVSQKCLDQINSLDLETKVKMFDASSKLIYPGMLHTYPVDMGIYDECIALDITKNSTRTLGKHCVFVGTNLSIPTNAVDLLKHSNNVVAKAANVNGFQKIFEIAASYCVPDQCSEKDLDILFKQYEQGGVVTFNFTKATCSTKETGKELDAWDFGFILTPALAMMYLSTITLMRRIGGGPIYDKNVNAFVTSCRKNALSFFFYYQNYYNYDDLCMTQTWYLSADMQMFWLSPIILLPTAYFVTKKYKAVMLSLISFSIFTVILPMIIKFIYQDYKNDYDTHSRLCNYIIGFTFGVFMRENIDKPFIFKKNKYLKNFLLWCIALGSMYVLVYLNGWIYIGNGTYAGKTVIESLMRPIWCLGLTWIVYSCFHGYGGVVNWILTRPILQFGSRLSYCMYLMHGSVIAHNVMMFRQKEIFSDWREFYLWCGYLIVTLMVALVWSLAFESPIIILEKVIFGASGKKKEHPTPPAKKTIQA